MFYKILFPLLLSGFVTSLYASVNASKLQENIKKINALQADFSQKVTQGNELIQQSKGKIALLRPGRFRWLSYSPTEQLIVADGKNLWVYDKDLEQVTVKEQKAGIGGTPAEFLSGYDNQFIKDYKIKETKQKSIDYFTLTPKKTDNPYQLIKLGFKRSILYSLLIKDNLGQKSEVILSNVKIPKTLNKSLFIFKPPKGVDVVQQ